MSELKPGTIVAIVSGGDWSDASCDHLKLLKPCDLKEAKAEWRRWYHNEYVLALMAAQRRPADNSKYPEYISFVAWLIKNGYAEEADVAEFRDE